MASCRRLFRHFVRLAASRTFCTAGRSRPISTAMTAITTSSSTSVKPRRLLIVRDRSTAIPSRCGRAGAGRGLAPSARLRLLFPQGGVPHLDLPVALVAAAGGQAPAVRAERHPQNRTRVTPEKQGLLRSRQVPDLHGLILAARCEPPAVRTEGDVEKPLGLPV